MRFVILEHDHPVMHWDLMLEAGDVLQTWRLMQPPESVGCAIEATALGDHRVMYLDYEGPVSGDRGTVKRWDAGEFSEDPDLVKFACWSGAAARHGRVCLERNNDAAWRLVWLSEKRHGMFAALTDFGARSKSAGRGRALPRIDSLRSSTCNTVISDFVCWSPCSSMTATGLPSCR